MAGQVLKTRRLANPRYRGKFRTSRKYSGDSRKIRRATKSGGGAKQKYYEQRSYARAFLTPGHGNLKNPHRRRPKMTPEQIKYFGTKRQKAALKNRGLKRRIRRARKLGSSTARQTSYYLKAHLKRKRARTANAGKHSFRKTKKRMTTLQRKGYYHPAMDQYLRKRKRRKNQGDIVSQVELAAEQAIQGIERAAEAAIGSVTHETSLSNSGRRRRNVGEILTIVPANPGKKRRNAMARTKNRRRRAAVSNRAHRRRNRNPIRRHRSRNPRVVVRYRNRKRLANRHHRRRNPNGNFLTGDAGAVVGVLGGAAVTKIVAGFLPSTLSTGIPGYITTGLIAVLAGNLTKRVTHNSKLGNWVTIGGLIMVGLQVAADYFPSLQLPFTTSSGTSGFGIIGSSNFYVPQVNQPGSMATFVTPAGIPAPVVLPATAMKGIGATGTSAMNSGLRRIGRMR